jgi:fatty-acyl-CoA synthase
LAPEGREVHNLKGFQTTSEAVHSMSEPESHPWVDGLTIGEALAETASRHRDRDSLVFPALDLKWSYNRLQQEVDLAARGLLRRGIGRGDHVALWATNVPEWVVLQFATARVGAVLVTINPAYRPQELTYVLRQSDAKALFLVRRFKSSDYYSMIREVCPELADGGPARLHCPQFPRLEWVGSLGEEPLPGAVGWFEFLRNAEAVEPSDVAKAAAACRPLDPINIQYTSGTTGFPKAATLSHRNLLLNAWYVGRCQRLTPSDRICIPVPFYHCFGCVLGTLCAVVHGAAMVIPAESFHPAATLEAIECERATALYGVPTMFIAELEDPALNRRDLSSLRTGIMAGSPCPIEVMKKVIHRLGAREMTIAYGQTEASPVVTQTRVDDPIELRVETVGRPIPGMEVMLVDPATGQEVGDGEQGEFCARGHGVMLGYYNQPEATRAAIDAEGWLHTGDLARRVHGEYYKITGRLKDMVIRGGENIYPREIEELLFSHPAIEQASVVGVPDPRFGEELCAWIKPKPDRALTEKEVREFCRSRLAHYKVPRYVRFVEAFPQTVTGKIQKFLIREQMMEELGLADQETA